jgi:hypothetical protein
LHRNERGQESGKEEKNLNKNDVIKALELEPHVEGGYFKRTFEASHRDKVDFGDGPRFSMTSIFYMLTDSSPIGHWHLNKSDIIHYYHLGGAITYHLIEPNGQAKTVVLGADISNGQVLQFTVKGGTWKASELAQGASFGLLSEAVSPGFEFVDMTLGEQALLLELFPQHQALIERFVLR